MSTATGGRRHPSRRAVVALVLGVALLVAAYAGGILLYASSQRGPAPVIENKDVPPDSLLALVKTTSIDPGKGDLVLRVEVRPEGALAGPDRVSVTRPVNIDVVGSTGKASYRYGPGDHISPIDVTIGLLGNTSSYPFDSYRAPFLVVATVPTSPTGSQPEQVGAAVPTQLEFDGTLSGYHVSSKPLDVPGNVENELSLDLRIRRARMTAAFAVLILFLQLLLCAAAFALAFSVAWRRRRRVEVTMLTWLAA